MDNQAKKGKIQVDALVISDLHLGSRSTRCQAVLNLLDRYAFSLLVLNGDILNGLRFKRLHTEHWDVLSRLRELSKDCHVVWVHGNHDADSGILSRLLGIEVYNRYIWESAGKKFLAIHGHQYDRFLKDSIIKSYLAFSAYYLIRRMDRSGFLPGYIKKHSVSWQRNSEEVAKGALRLGRFLKADYVFCGHIHKLHTAKKKGVAYFNTASWNDKPSGYALVKDGKVELLSE